MAELDARRNAVLGRLAGIIQRKVRSYFSRKTLILLQKSAIHLQSVCRSTSYLQRPGQLARRHYVNIRRQVASLRIQTCYRMHFSTFTYKILYVSSLVIQAGLRGMVAWKELHFRRQTRAATIIQSHCRRCQAQLHYSRIKQSAITTQCAWRGRLARRELRKLKMEHHKIVVEHAKGAEPMAEESSAKALDVSPMSIDEPNSARVEQGNHNKLADGPTVVHPKL